MSYGVFRQSLLYPNQEPDWSVIKGIFLIPYLMLYGSLTVDQVDQCGKPEDTLECVPGLWLNPLMMTIYLLVAAVLLVNLLIAAFSALFHETENFNNEFWKFNRFGVLMEYEQKAFLPPPIIFLSHIYLTFKWCYKRLRS